MNRYLQGEHVPEWMTKGKTTLIQKDVRKETVPNNYRPITCFLKMWKILTTQKREKIYYSLTSCRLFSEEQKRCRSGKAELLYIDQHILNKSRTRRINQAIAWIDYKKFMTWSRKAASKCTKSHKLYQENHENMASWIDSRKKKLNWNKVSKRYFSRRCPITLTIHYCHDAT